MNDIPTPRTDAVQTKAEHEDYDVELAMIVSHARQLERELAQALNERKFHKDWATQYMWERNDARREIAELKAERDSPSGVHSCHQACQRPMCKLRRELAEARETISYMVENGNAAYEEVKAQRDALAGALRRCLPYVDPLISGVRYAETLQALSAVKGAADE